MKTLFLCFLAAAAVRDWRTMYFSKHWFWICLGMIPVYYQFSFFLPAESIPGAFLFSMPAFFFHHYKQWLGSADVWFLGYFGFILGYPRMIVAMMIAVPIGLTYLAISKKAAVPFVSCLCIGVSASLFWGYHIWYQWF
ncbi:prepilin peptidase [Catenisphaera adipataccumulans]|uniref:Prepilin signal peptidase PulO-like enzyme (Type II secretory pathway) n=1 Tax=Catenisphaera adipataccumulans TaxID=700500 RepID=A0A7W8D139_9FIRM|nr:prepilin peptidase [Catenisphaera adipataccumulans]MBB5183620.1 prepilin signal peptidase PulO-like enzyme (type II secretory pathway) [Catenisphaera adipataccumulans]